jgi:type III secretion protein J
MQRLQSTRSQKRKAITKVALLCVCLGLAACKDDLYSRLDETQANEMVAILRENGIGADRRIDKDRTITVRVEDSRFPDAVDLLKAHGYPRQSFSNMGAIFNSGSLIVSPTEERAKMMYALSEELARTISSLDGVLTARVHIVLEEDDILHQNNKPSAAAVFIRYSAGIPADHFLPQIKMLVANAVSGVTYDKVSVILVPVEAAPPPARSAMPQFADTLPGLPLTLLVGGAIVLVLGAAGAAAFLRRHPTPKPEMLE